MDSSERVAQFERIVSPHLTRAYSLARLLVGNPADAEDLVQEASLRAFRALDGYHGGDAKSWLLVIVRNTCYTFLSRNRGSEAVEFEEEQHSSSTATPESAALSNASAADVRRAIEQLPAEFRETLVLREMEDMSYRQIAEITEVPVGTVMSRLSRARQFLRKKLEQSAERGANHAM